MRNRKPQDEMLKTIIERAVEGGFDDDTVKFVFDVWGIEHVMTNDFELSPKYYQILFNHDFAKAFFGEENYNGEEYTMFDHNHRFIGYIGRDIKEWQYHLQQAVLSEDPITYYYENYEKPETK